jgi:hypothetical protein
LTLQGTADRDVLYEAISDIGALKGELRSLEICDLTLPCLESRSLEKDVSLRGAFYKAIYPSLISEDQNVRARATRALQIGLAAIDGRKIPMQEGDNENS